MGGNITTRENLHEKSSTSPKSDPNRTCVHRDVLVLKILRYIITCNRGSELNKLAHFIRKSKTYSTRVRFAVPGIEIDELLDKGLFLPHFLRF